MGPGPGLGKPPGGGGGGGDFVTATFTVGADTNLQSYTGEVGATPTLHPSYSGTILVNASLDRIYLNTSSAAGYYFSDTPPSANYCVQADFFRVSQIVINIGIMLGFDTSADTGVLLRLSDSSTTVSWEVIERVSGSNTVLSSISTNIPTVGGAAVNAKLCRSGTAITVFFDTVQNTSLNSTTSLTAVGKAGVRFSGQASSTTGMHLDNFSAR
jgi:hypothetical protein